MGRYEKEMEAINGARFGKSMLVVTLRLLARLRCLDWVQTIAQSSLVQA